MKKDLTKLAMLGLLAGACVSAYQPMSGKEIAMSKCSRDPTAPTSDGTKSDPNKSNDPIDDDSSCNSQSGCDGNTGCSECESDTLEEASASEVMKTKRIHAAGKI
jgi:hypothetical protein